MINSSENRHSMTGARYAILAAIVACLSAGVASVTDREFEELSAMVRYLREENMMLKEMLLNNTIEERVTLLEIQMADSQEDISELEEDVAILVENDNFLFDEQVIQDERLFSLETETEEIEEEVESVQALTVELDNRVSILEENGGSDGNSSVSELEVRVETLEGTAADHETRLTAAESEIEDLDGTTEDHETRITAAEENIQGLQAADVNLDSRITALEENGNGNGTIGFHTVLTSYTTIATGATVIFNEILLNEGDGYDSTTGVFTVPPGGDGLYYFSIHLSVYYGEYGRFAIQLNDVTVCSSYGDHNSNGASDSAQATCSALLDVAEGDEVKVEYVAGSNNTPLLLISGYLFNGFNGFRI